MEKLGWILLRGLAREAGHWGDFPDRLGKSFPGSRVAALDLPGAGVFWKRRALVSPEGTVGFLRDQARDFGLADEKDKDRRWILLAVSLGAMLGIQWLRDYPDDFWGGVLINTSLPGLNPVFQRLTPFGALQSAKSLLTYEVEAKERAILKMVSNSPEVRRRLLPSWVEIHQARTVSVPNQVRQLLLARSFEAPKAAPHPNVLLVVSEKDRMVSCKCTKAIGEVWGLTPLIHPWAGHELVGDDPEWMLGQLHRWLAGREQA